VAIALTLIAPAGLRSVSAETPTRVHEFRAFRAGALVDRLKVTASTTGSCGGPSLVVGRASAYAWRCSTHSIIRDPCFSAFAESRKVVCPMVPWKANVVRVRLTSRLPSEPYLAHSEKNPWAIWTANGKRCMSYAGSGLATMNGKPVTYGCRRGGILLGYADTRHRPWTIYYAAHYVPPRHGRRRPPMLRVGITDIWR
jgi:hypothetical protein